MMPSIKPCRFACSTVVTVLLAVLSSAAYAQLSFHNDPSQNSFSIKLPAFQQSFTRYFGNQPQGALLQQQQQQQPQQLQQQIPSTLTHPSLIGSQAQAYQQQQQQQQQPLYYQQPAQQQAQPDALNRYVAQFPDQPHYTVQENYINPNIRQRLQQQRLLQQQQQYHPSQTNQYQGFTGSFGAPGQTVPTAQDAGAYSNQQQQPQYEYVQQTTGAEGQQQQQEQFAQPQYQPTSGQFGVRGHQQQQQQQQQQMGSEGDASTAAKLIGVAFSPSNEVSQVKFSSGGLKYNF